MNIVKSIALIGMFGAVAASAPALTQDAISDYTPVTDDYLQDPPAGDWPMYRRTWGSWGFSPLDQITPENVSDLELVWSRAMGPGNSEATPLEHDGIMFLPSPGNLIQAIDAATGDLIWEYNRPLTEGAYSLGQIQRSIALYEDKVIAVTQDNYVVALEATSGQVLWETARADGLDTSNSTGPLVADGKIFTGSTCTYTLAGGCYAAAYDVENGEELWLNRVVPRPGDPLDETWGNLPLESRIHTGVWGALSYDPDLNLVFYGSSSTAPSSPTLGGRPLWNEGGSLAGTNERFAVDADTGEIAWRHQLMPGANWDQECTFEAVIAEIPLNINADAEGVYVGPDASSGETRLVQTGVPCKTGFIWTADAETGEFLWAKQTVFQNMYTEIDAEGFPQLNNDTILMEAGETKLVCPTFTGGRDWAPVAFNPNTNVLFIPLNNHCADMTAFAEEPVLSYQVISDLVLRPESNNMIGRIDAVDLETGETLWSYEQRAPNYSPVMATGGGLIFSGDQARNFRAHSQETGEVLWQTRLPSEVAGHAITYEVNGRQYVAITVGTSLSGASIATLAPEIDFIGGANAVYVFALSE